jgi:hypothetical protein
VDQALVFVPARETDGLIPAARILARCVALAQPDAEQARGYAKRVVDLLRESVRRGYKETDRVKSFGKDEKLIAERDDYRQLLQKLIKLETRKK